MSVRHLLLVACVFSIGCSSSSAPNAEEDAATGGTDAGHVGVDGGVARDAGQQLPDTGVRVDAGATATDAGTDSDAGPATDAGSEPVDAFVPEPVDAGADANLCGGVDCSAMNGTCQVGVCNPTTGACMAMPLTGTSCDDGVACTTGDVCTAGTCAGTMVDCSGMTDGCHIGMCRAADGVCVQMNRDNGTTCDDGSACTSGDVCTAGTCGGTAMDCSSFADQCNAGVCTAGACGAMPVANGTACRVSNPCLWSSACTAGACGGGVVGACLATGVSAAGSVSTPVGGGGGGGPFSDACPVGEVMIGVEARITSGFYNQILSQVATLCGRPAIGPSVITVAASTRVPATGGHGSTGGTLATVSCPANQVVVGFGGSVASGYVSQVLLRCASLSLTGSPMGGFAITTGTPTATAPIGTRVGTAMAMTDCPAGTTAVGIAGRNGEVLDAFGLRCGAPSADVTTTSPRIGGAGGGENLDDCPAGQVPVSITAYRTSGFYTDNLTQYFMQCGTLAAGAGGAVTITAGARVPTSGSRGGSSAVVGGAMTSTCPANQAIVGISGRAGTYTNQVTPRCAPLTVGAGNVLTYGTITAATAVGAVAGSASGPYDCPTGMVASGLSVRSGDVVDGVAIRCQRKTLP